MCRRTTRSQHPSPQLTHTTLPIQPPLLVKPIQRPTRTQLNKPCSPSRSPKILNPLTSIIPKPLQHKQNQRIARKKMIPPRLPIPIPQMLVPPCASHRSPKHPPKPNSPRHIDINNRLRLPRHQPLQLTNVIAVDHPTVRILIDDPLNFLPKNLGIYVFPVRQPVNRIQLHIRQIKIISQSPRQTRFTAPTRNQNFSTKI